MSHDGAVSTAHILGATCVATVLGGAVELISVHTRPPMLGGWDAWVVSMAAVSGVMGWAAVGGGLAALLLRSAGVRRRILQVGTVPAWAVGATCMTAAVALDWSNATQYVRLYLAIHVALSLLSALCATVGALMFLVRWRPSDVTRRVQAGGASILAIVLVVSAVLVFVAPQREAAALEKSTRLAHWVLLVRAVSPGAARVASPASPSVSAPTRVSASGLAANAHVLLVTFDAMRGDALHAGNPTLALTNALALAKEGTVFRAAYSPSCWTVPAMAATLTSRYPSDLTYDLVVVDQDLKFFVVDREDGLLANPFAKRAIPAPPRDRTPTFAGLLRQHGYQTLTVPSWEIYHPRAGITRDFEFVDDGPLRSVVEKGLSGKKDVEITQAALSLLAAADTSKPVFLWLHYMAPHAPYEARYGVGEKAPDQERYESELRYVDEEAGKVLAAFRARGMLDNTIVVLHGDHGEEFGEHGGKFHASSLYDEQVRVSFVVRLPPRIRAKRGQTVDTPVSLLDLTPTLFDLLGIEPTVPLVGRSLVPLLMGESLPIRPVTAVCDRWGRQKRSVVVWPYKLIVDDTVTTMQLYNLEDDPAERRPLRDDARVKSLFGLLPPMSRK